MERKAEQDDKKKGKETWRERKICRRAPGFSQKTPAIILPSSLAYNTCSYAFDMPFQISRFYTFTTTRHLYATKLSVITLEFLFIVLKYIFSSKHFACAIPVIAYISYISIILILYCTQPKPCALFFHSAKIQCSTYKCISTSKLLH
jgi:hypothetical protein